MVGGRPLAAAVRGRVFREGAAGTGPGKGTGMGTGMSPGPGTGTGPGSEPATGARTGPGVVMWLRPWSAGPRLPAARPFPRYSSSNALFNIYFKYFINQIFNP